jgi:hypothetical protein
MTSLRMLTALGAAISMAAAHHAPAPASGAGSPIMTALRLEKPTYSLHEPVVATLEIYNRTTASMNLDLGKNSIGNLGVLVTDPTGHREMGKLPPELPDGISFPGYITLPASGRYDKELVLNDWYAFTQLGRYTIRLDLLNQAASPNATALSATSSLEVGPQNSAELRATCERLAQRALAGSGANVDVAAHALSFAADEVCLPAMARVFHAGFRPRISVVDGLARLGTEKALAVIVGEWDSLDKLSQQIVSQAFSIAGRIAILREALAKAGKSLPSATF